MMSKSDKLSESKKVEMPKKCHCPVVPPIMPKASATSRAEEILECTSLFAEALDDLHMEAVMNLEENQEQESAARKALGFDPVPGHIEKVLA